MLPSPESVFVAYESTSPANEVPPATSPDTAIAADELVLYTIVEAHRRGTTLAETIGRRERHWATPDTGLLRMATSVPLAMLDLLVQLEGPTPHALILVALRIPCPLVDRLDRYPDGWNTLPCPKTVRPSGDDWACGAGRLALRVPSVVCPGESNVLLNPAHANADCIDRYTMSAFRLDPRLRA